jgi:hypothetical protein
MTINKWYALTFKLIFLVVFNIFFFTLDGDLQSQSVFYAYTLIHISYFVLVLTPFFAGKTKQSIEYKRPLNIISGIYFFASFLFGLIVFISKPQNETAVLLISIGISAIYAFVLFGNLVVNSDSIEQELKREVELVYVKDISSQLNILKSKIKNADLVFLLEEAYDLIHSSPAKSNEKVKHLEIKVQVAVNQIAISLQNNQEMQILKFLKEVIEIAHERNRILSNLN